MNNNFIKKIQDKIIKLLKRKNKPLCLLAEDNCSEMSRLVGCWILEKMPNSKILIVKGKNVMNIKNKCHDILLVESDEKIYVIDSTVWQFFKNKRSILIGIEKDTKRALNNIKNIYKGNWKISEKLSEKDCRQKSEWEAIIKQNIAEL